MTISNLSDLVALESDSEALLYSKKELWQEETLKSTIEKSCFRFMIEDYVTGSSLFTSEQLINMIREIKSKKPELKKIYIVDLMKEYHGFCSYEGQYFPFVWRGTNNHVNKDLHNDKLLERQKIILDVMSKADNLSMVINYSKKNSDINHIHKSIIIQNPQPITEEILLEIISREFDFELIYKPLPLVDHLHPDLQTIIKLASFIEKDFNPADSVIHFHCHGGKGRTTSMGLIVDMLKQTEEHKLSDNTFHSFVAKQTAITGYDLASTSKAASIERYNFLESLYGKLVQIEKYQVQDKISLALEIFFLHDANQLNDQGFETLLDQYKFCDYEKALLQNFYENIIE